MTGERIEGVTRTGFHDAEEALVSAEEILDALHAYKQRLGKSALTASAKDVLLPVSQEMAKAASRVADTISELEVKELFGDEDSYWNVFRYFCVEGNRGAVRTIEEVWDHLALSFDMTGETLETLSETLLEWEGDIEADAKLKFGVVGKFEALGHGYVFYEQLILQPEEPAQPPVRKTPVRREKPKPVQVKVAEKVPERESSPEKTNLEKHLGYVLNDMLRATKQSDVIKLVLGYAPWVERKKILALIDEKVASGEIFKFKPGRNKPAYIAINAEDVFSEEEAESGKTPEVEAEIDIQLAKEVLSLLLAHGRKVGQMSATSHMIRNLFQDEDGSRQVTIRELNVIARRLEEAKLVRTDKGSPLAGKRQKSRGRSHSVFRVGIPDAKTNELVKSLIKGNELEDYLSGRAIVEES